MSATITLVREGDPEARDATANPGVLTLVDWILRDRERLRLALRDEQVQPRILPRLVAIAVATLAFFGLVMSGVLLATGARLGFMTPAGLDRPAFLAMPLAYPLGLLGAIGICLPSFYFYALQCGFAPSFRRIVTQTVAGGAFTGIFLVGILPIYAAAIIAVERLGGGLDALWLWSAIGLFLPVLAGLTGVNECYLGFLALADSLPEERRGRRAGMIGLLALWSTGLYAVVAPVLVYQLLKTFGAWTI